MLWYQSDSESTVTRQEMRQTDTAVTEGSLFARNVAATTFSKYALMMETGTNTSIS